jgi:hypothetical protein
MGHFRHADDIFRFLRDSSKEFESPGIRENKKNILIELLERLRKRVMEIADDWLLHNDNAPGHIALSVRKFLGISPPPHPHPASPDLSPCDFCLFPKLKSRVKGYHFQTFDSVQNAITDAIKTLREHDFQS